MNQYIEKKSKEIIITYNKKIEIKNINEIQEKINLKYDTLRKNLIEEVFNIIEKLKQDEMFKICNEFKK
jgi:hypothetical protein